MSNIINNAFKVWDPRAQTFIDWYPEIEAAHCIFLAYAERDTDDGTPLYDGDIIATDAGTGTIKRGTDGWVIDLLGHNEQPLAEQAGISYLGNRFTHLPNGAVIDLI